MTKKELSQLYWLNREIEDEKRKLEELEAAAGGCTQSITGLPHVGGAGNKIGDLAILIAEQRDLIRLLVKQSVIEYNRLNRYITQVEDAQMRLILSLRYVDGLSWQQVALRMGVEGDGSTQRKQHNAFLRKVSLIS